MKHRNEEQDDSVDSNEIHLFEQEEQDFLEIQLEALMLAPEDEITRCGNETSSDEPTTLRLRQFGTSNEQWGIHSFVWDGGIALLYHVATHWDPVVQILPRQMNRPSDATALEHTFDSTYLIDLGSGTGVAGLGISAMTRGRCAVALTDQTEALSLLEQNVRLNLEHFLDDDRQTTASHNRTATAVPVVHELTWGSPTVRLTEWLPSFLMSHSSTDATVDGMSRGQRHILITGADIVYRPSLFEPLLVTLIELHSQLVAWDETARIDVWLSCQSVRSHLDEFWIMARSYGWHAHLKSIVQLHEPYKTDLSRILSTTVDLELPSSTKLDKGHGINWIVSMTRIESTGIC